jgi:hypothetical protein
MPNQKHLARWAVKASRGDYGGVRGKAAGKKLFIFVIQGE